MLDAPRDPAAERSAVGAYCVYIAISLLAIHFGLTKRGTPERLAYTHLLWWYPFVFLLLYHAFAAVRELHVDLETRWTGTTEESYVFFRLYVAAQVCGCFVEVGTTELGAKLFQMLAHHVISIVAYGVALTDGRCHFFGCAAGLSEVSTIFLQGVLFSKHPHAKEWWPEWFTIFNGVSLWACYIPFRLVLFPAITALYVADARRDPGEPPSAGNNEPPSAGNNATPPRKPEAAIGEADARRPREALEIRALSAGLTALVMALALDLELHGRARLVEEVRLEEAAMALATAWAGVLTVVAGYYAHPGWRALQPFEGGGGFVTVQALGWMLYACSLFAIVVMAANAPAGPRGAAFAVGCLGSFACASLNLSLRLYVAALRPAGAPRRRSARRGTLTALALLLALSGVVLCGAGDAPSGPRGPAEPSRALLAALEASAPSLIASGAGCLGIGALALAWTLCGVVSDVLLAVGPGAAGRIAGFPLALGVAGAAANVVLVASLDHFEADKPASRARAPPSPRASPERLAALLFLACSVVGFALGIYAPRYAAEKAPAYVMATFLAPGAAPLAHVGGARARRGYGVFMVGVGGPKFVITQACGWMLYSVSVLATIVVLCLNDAAPRPLMVALAPLAVISSGIIVASVPLFEAQETAFPEATGGDSADVERCRRAWGVSCDAAKLFADDGAGGAPARAAAARAACEELWRLRQAAASAPALLDAAVAARRDAASSLGLDIDPREEPADDDDDPDPGDLRLGDDLALDGGLARRRRRRRAAVEFLGVLAAPLASALGVGLLATAESLEGQLSPALAACACAATFAAAPLQFRLERGDRGGGRFVALRLVALAAWSFAVLASLAALLRYSLGRGRGAISREFFGDASGSPSPHALLGLGGVGLQGLALLLSEASGAPKHRESKPASPRKAPKPDWRRRLALVLDREDGGRDGGRLSARSVPEEVWLLVEAHLRAPDLATLAATAKRQTWCSVYAKPARWRRLFAGAAPRRAARVAAPAASPLAALGDCYDRLEAMLAFAFSRGRSRAARRGSFSRAPPAAVADDGARALGWKFACFLHDRGAPVLRCGICGDVDDAQGPNEFVLAPCAACGADGARATGGASKARGLPVVAGAAGAAGRDVGACARCGRGLAPGLRHPAGPRELGAASGATATAAAGARRALFSASRSRRASRRARRAASPGPAGVRRRRGRRAAFAAWLAVQCSLVHLFASPAFSVMVSRIWTGPRDHVRFYLRLYAYYVGAGAAVVAHFSPLAGLLAQVDCAAPSAFRRCAAALLGLASWLNLAGYAAVSSASLFLFAKANYPLLTVADTA
ncbi:histone demethylase [Aureococcus anophagefferens]|nr:histone demethylase [Aureococcus anophagefferens]